MSGDWVRTLIVVVAYFTGAIIGVGIALKILEYKVHRDCERRKRELYVNVIRMYRLFYEDKLTKEDAERLDMMEQFFRHYKSGDGIIDGKRIIRF